MKDAVFRVARNCWWYAEGAPYIRWLNTSRIQHKPTSPLTQQAMNVCYLQKSCLSTNQTQTSQPSVLSQQFNQMLQQNKLEPNESQLSLIKKLEALTNKIESELHSPSNAFDIQHSPIHKETKVESEKESFKGGWGSLWKRLSNSDDPIRAQPNRYQDVTPPIRIKGLYIWGGVGQGKTMLMDAFYDNLKLEKKRRVHFHRFMLEIHKRLHAIKVSKNARDALLEVAREISANCTLLCFDEFQVTHVDDAMILKRLFEILFKLGISVVATSNVHPRDLYRNGLNRGLFVPFIDLLQKQCEVFEIDTKKDFRLQKEFSGSLKFYYAPSRSEEEVLKNAKYLSGGVEARPQNLQVTSKRVINIPYGVDGIGVFDFDTLCCGPIGSIDYISFADAYHTLFLHSIPSLQEMEQMPSAILRFISLIDILYERKNRVIFDAELPLFQLFGESEAISAFEKLRKELTDRFSNLEEALNLLKQFCGGAKEMNLQQTIDAFSRLTALSVEDITVIYQSLVKESSSGLTPKMIRSALFYHRRLYDFVPPTTKDSFIFGGMEEQSIDPAKELSGGYKLKSEMKAATAVDIRFTYHRTVSRISEMIGHHYIDEHQKKYNLNDLKYFGTTVD